VAVVLIAASYLLPLMAATGATDAPPETWENGYLADAAGTYKLPLRAIKNLQTALYMVVRDKNLILVSISMLLLMVL